MWAVFNRFEIKLTRDLAEAGSHQGDCESDIAYLLRYPLIYRQLNKIPPDAIRSELRDYGAWDSEELADDNANRARILWLACGNIVDEKSE